MTIGNAIAIADVLFNDYCDKKEKLRKKVIEGKCNDEDVKDFYRIYVDEAKKLYEAFLNTEILPERNRGKL